MIASLFKKEVKPSEEVLEQEGAMESQKEPLNTIKLKRQITVKSLVTEQFRQNAKNELSEELKLVDTQLQQLENQYHNMLQQIENLAKTGQNVTRQLEQLNMEVQEKRTQLANIKIQVTTNLANLDRAQNGEMVVTGVLENYVEVQIGDNIYERLRGAEVIIEDGIVKTINA
jgi:chromosome segregation ATPase